MSTDTPRSQATSSRSWLHGWRLALVIAAAIIVMLLLFVRFALSPIVTSMVNRRLAELPDHTGKVERVRLALWRGTVEVEKFVLSPRKSPEHGPVADIPHAWFSFDWGPVFRGKLGADARIEDARFTLYNDDATPAEKDEDDRSEEQKREDRTDKVERISEWQIELREAFPVEISRAEVRNAHLRVVDRTVEPHLEVALEQVQVVATGLRNRREPQDQEKNDLPARVTFQAVVESGGSITLDLEADPIADLPRFRVNMQVIALQLPPLNDFVRAYAKSVVESGRFDFFAEINAEGGTYEGYMKPFFEELDFRAEKEEGLVRRAVTAVASAAATLLESDEDKAATVVPIEGNFTDNEVDIWTTVRNLLRNAFVQALREGFGTPQANTD